VGSRGVSLEGDGMKKLLVLLVFVSLPFIASAQGAQGKILVVCSIPDKSAPHLVTLLPTLYHGEVIVLNALPNDPSPFDAIALVGTEYFRDTLSIENQLALIEYLKKGGNLYCEWNWQLHWLGSDPDPRDTLWNFIGARQEMATAAFERYGGVVGIDSEFTRGIAFAHEHSDPLQTDASGGYGIGPDLDPILVSSAFGDAYSTSWTRAMAWVSKDRSIHAVLHAPRVWEYYDTFIQRTFCDYFGLCSSEVMPWNSSSPLDLRVISNGDHVVLDFTGESKSTVRIVSVLGSNVFESTAQEGVNRIELPSTLSPGVYFARVQTASALAVKPFVILSR